MRLSTHISNLILILTLLPEIACNKTIESRTISNPPAVTTNAYLALGDSYTIGQGVSLLESFPMQTKQWLEMNNVLVPQVDIIATTGWTTFDLTNAIISRNPASTYSWVSLLIGVNDQYSRRDTTGYRTAFRNILQRAILLAANKPSRVFVLSIPDYSVTPFAASSDTTIIRQQIDWFNRINKEITIQLSCKYLDITPSTREGRYDRSLLAADGLHPSGIEYRKWAERLGPMMKDAL